MTRTGWETEADHAPGYSGILFAGECFQEFAKGRLSKFHCSGLRPEISFSEPDGELPPLAIDFPFPARVRLPALDHLDSVFAFGVRAPHGRTVARPPLLRMLL